MSSPDVGKRLSTNVAMEVGENLCRLRLDSEEYVVMTIVVDSFSGNPVTIRGIKIEYCNTMCTSISSSINPIVDITIADLHLNNLANK